MNLFAHVLCIGALVGSALLLIAVARRELADRRREDEVLERAERAVASNVVRVEFGPRRTETLGRVTRRDAL